MGLDFANPVGLAAGLDKNGEYIDALGCLGFGFIEVGAVTPKAQAGNPKPRIFRLKRHHALINAMGFPNKGLAYMIERLRRRRYQGVLGVNLGKNASTPLSEAVNDYKACMIGLYPYVDFLTVNISSPNTPGLRELQGGEYLDHLLETLKHEQTELHRLHNKYVPLLVKVAPDLDDGDIHGMAACFKRHNIDGVIATNTSFSRQGVEEHKDSERFGGLSGRPIAERANHVIAKLYEALGNDIPLIGVGGIDSVASAKDKFAAGASLIQVYTGLIYQGPGLVRELVKNTPDSSLVKRSGDTRSG
tara:strand:- start:1728 stop:2636 length:909 start_codon:yes stop_codon:yes gene_type:complete